MCFRKIRILFFLSGFSFKYIHDSQDSRGRGGYLDNSSLPLPPASQTLRNKPGNYCRELTSAHSSQPDSNREPVVSERMSLTTKLRATRRKLRIRVDFPNDTFNYFLVKDPIFARFHLLPKIHKCSHNVPGKPFVSNCRFYTENISSFPDHYLEPIAQKVNSFIKDTKNLLQKIKSLGQLLAGAILCTIDVVGLYPYIPHEVGLSSHRCKDVEKSVD